MKRYNRRNLGRPRFCGATIFILRSKGYRSNDGLGLLLEEIGADGGDAGWRIDALEADTNLHGGGGYGRAALSDGYLGGSGWNAEQGR